MHSTSKYERKILPHERQVLWHLSSNIAIGAKIKGFFTEKQFRSAVDKLQELHPLLKVKVVIDKNHEAWFTSEGVSSIPIKIIKRKTDTQWITEFLNEHKKTFELGKGPLAKFILVKSEENSELIIICHHIICDGKCLPILVRDVLSYINDKNQKLFKRTEGPLLLSNNIPSDIKKNYFKEIGMKILNNSWKKNEIIVSEKDYHLISKRYWEKYNYRLIVKEFTKKETSGLVDICHKNRITVTSAICMAVHEAFQDIKQRGKQKIDVSVDLRKFLIDFPGDTIGNYVGKIKFISKYNQRKSFWDNARVLHEKMSNKLNKNRGFEWVFDYNIMEPTLIDAVPFIISKEIILSDSKKYENLSKLFEKKNFAISLIERGKTSISKLLFANIGKLDCPVNYGCLELDRLIPLPSASRLLDLIIGIETVGGKMTMTFNYIEEIIDSSTVEKITNRVVDLLEINN